MERCVCKVTGGTVHLVVLKCVMERLGELSVMITGIIMMLV